MKKEEVGRNWTGCSCSRFVLVSIRNVDIRHIDLCFLLNLQKLTGKTPNEWICTPTCRSPRVRRPRRWTPMASPRRRPAGALVLFTLLSLRCSCRAAATAPRAASMNLSDSRASGCSVEGRAAHGAAEHARSGQGQDCRDKQAIGQCGTCSGPPAIAFIYLNRYGLWLMLTLVGLTRRALQ